MLKRIDIPSSIKSGAVAALAFAIPVFIYILKESYADSWLIYLGSFLFFVVVVIHTIFNGTGVPRQRPCRKSFSRYTN
jgi:hypothetical protein